MTKEEAIDKIKSKVSDQIQASVDVFLKDNPFSHSEIDNTLVLLVTEQVGRVSKAMLDDKNWEVKKHMMGLIVLLVAVWQKRGIENFEMMCENFHGKEDTMESMCEYVTSANRTEW